MFIAKKHAASMLFLITLFPSVILARPIPFNEVRRYNFEYQVKIPPTQAAAEPFSLWVPYPAEDMVQRVLGFTVDSPFPWKITRESQFGNRMVYIEGTHGSKRLTLRFNYRIERKPYRGIPNNQLTQLEYAAPDKYLKTLADISLYPEIVRIAQAEAAGSKSESEKIHKFYQYVVKTLRYDKSGTGWGHGDPIWACSTRRGNCTDFHSLFVAMSRTQGIPARFAIGVSIPYEQDQGEIRGYHCWAEAYDPSFGWRPLDATEAKKTGEVERYFGNLPSNRIHLSTGRKVTLNPPQKGEPLNYFVYPYAEQNGKPMKGLSKRFSYSVLTVPEKS